MTAIYSFLHMLVDGICALAMFGNYMGAEEGRFLFLIYNFCAFALQMPIGVLLDFINLKYEEKQSEFSCWFATLGVGMTLLGAITHPIVLGIGNALFHVGGGVGTCKEDEAKGWKGKGLGVFVAPGALGLYLGTILAKKGVWEISLWMIAGLAVLLTSSAWNLYHKECRKKHRGISTTEFFSPKNHLIMLVCCCFGVVILRSYIGMEVAFSWKQIPLWGLVSVLAVVCGKVAGGFVAAKFGYCRTIVITLTVAAIGYYGLERIPLGLVALFAFNMTMPITLHLVIQGLPKLPGFAFGLLTFGLFLGFLPTYFGWQLLGNGQQLGTVGSVFSMIILLIGIRQGGMHDAVSD